MSSDTMSSTPEGGMARNIPAVHANLSKKDQKALAKIRRKADNLLRIKTANSKRIEDVCASTKSLDTAPERKPSVRFHDDCRPALNIGDYIKVTADTSPGNNRHEGYGFVVKTSGVGAATLFSVKFSFCVNNQGRTFHKVTLKSITPSNFQESYSTGSKTKRTIRQIMDDTSPSVAPPKIDTRLPVRKLLDSMAEGGRTNKKKGWYRESLNL